jgi:hypothetical protein
MFLEPRNYHSNPRLEGTLMEACSMIFVRFAVQLILIDCVPAIRAGIDSYFSAEQLVTA